MRQAGKLDRFLTIQRRTASAADDAGVPIETWTDLVTLRAMKVKGVAADTAQQGIAVTDTRVRLQTWFYDGLTLEDRASYEGATYLIKWIEEIGGRRRGLEIHIEKLGQ